MEAKAIVKRILEEFWRIPLFDVHSHFCSESGPVESVDSYIANWTQPETRPPEVEDRGMGAWRMERWPMKRSLWMSRAFRAALGELYGTENAFEICRAMNGVRNGGLLAAIDWMRRKANVEVIVVDSNPQLASRDNRIISTYHLNARVILHRACDLASVVDGLEAEIERGRNAGSMGCLKVAMAYDRSLCIEEAGYEEAASAALKDPAHRSPDEQKLAEDYLYRHFFSKAADWSMPVEIHTGFGWAIHDRPLRLSEADPENLLPILEDAGYRKTKFVLFHGGYPFLSKMGYIAGTFSNVYLDFTCLCPESWTVLKHALHEWIDIVPMDKIVTGSDGSYEWLYFAAKYNRECLAEVLGEKVCSEHMDLDLALDVGRHVLRENARRVFGAESS